MKKLLTITAALFVFASVFTSCKKDYTCKCTVTYSGSSFYSDTSYSVSTVINGKKKDAENSCNAGTSSISDGFGGTIAESCAIQK